MKKLQPSVGAAAYERATTPKIIATLALVFGLLILAPVPAQAGEAVISKVSVAPATFYPLVRDGYRDTTTIRFRQSTRARMVMRVFNSNRVNIATDRYGYQGAGRHRVRWNGRNRQGNRVRPGVYTIALTGTTRGGRDRTVRRRVRVETDTVTRRRTVSRNGADTLRRQRRGSCHFVRWGPELQLDCWGGRYARATYQFRLPASARNITWDVYGTRGCCSDGRVRFRGWRVNNRAVRVSTTVTNWRSYEVREVAVTYSYRKRR